MTSPRTNVDSIGPLCRWAVGRAVRRWPALLAVFATMLLTIGFGVLQPWPMKWLVDHVLLGVPMGPGLARATAALPGAATREGLLTWCVAATVVLFVLGWSLGVASSWTNIAFGRRLVYDLAADLFAHLQALSLRFHARASVGERLP